MPHHTPGQPPAPTTARPLLVPGAHVLRRHDGRLQVGLDPRTAVLLPSGSESALRRLDGSRATLDTADAALLARLDSAGLLVDESVLLPLVSTLPAAEAAAAAALVRAHGAGAREVHRRRTGTTLQVLGYGAGGDGLAARARALLAEASVGSTAAPGDQHPPDAPALLVGVGEPDRELLDDWMRTGTPHLLVRLSEGRAVAGPFVVPGRSACLRCLDAHHTDADPTWPLLVRQYAAACRRPRADGAPEPVDPLLATVALAWAVRDLATWLEGDDPSLWSATLTLDPALREVEARSWTRHPGCGCSWQAERDVPARPVSRVG
jgi:bacteriocin biosynthesis cyclodehydratase domain-containing protein